MSLRKRPGGVTAVAIINIVLGSLALLVALCGGFMIMAGSELVRNDPMAAAMEDFMRRQLPFYDVVQWTNITVTLVQAIALLVTGIGVLNLRNWARVTAVWCAVLSLFWIVVQAVYYFAFTAPVMERFFRDFGGGMGPGANPRLIATISSVFQVILWLALSTYAIILISVLTRGQVRELYASEGDSAENFDRRQNDDDDWYEKRRQREPREDVD